MQEDGFEYPLPDDEQAAEAEQVEQEREKLDEALSEDDEPSQPVDPHADEREALGFDLAWWAEEGEHNTPPLDIVVDWANQACGRTHYMRALEEFGYDPKQSIGYIGLDAVTGPLVVAGLQILGTLHSHVREEVTKVLKQIFDAVPDTSDEQAESFTQAAEQYERKMMLDFAEQMGVQVMTPDEYAEQVVEQDESRRNASNN